MNTRRDRVIHTGDIHLIFEFEAPPGIRYPQHAPGIDSFDEKDRISKLAEELKAQQIAELDAGRKDKAELADQILDRQRAAKRVRTTEFTDGEIEAAFKFIDLDHNGYVGAAEIRHVLVCMGELITDEEVDMMIKMVDSDGDGQFSFTEFYNVVTDPDPAHTDFVKMAAQEEEDPDQTGDPGQMDAKAHERHKEITLRNKKREMMEAFTVFGSVKLQLCFNLGFVVVFVRCFCLYSVVCISRGSWPSLGRSEGRDDFRTDNMPMKTDSRAVQRSWTLIHNSKVSAVSLRAVSCSCTGSRNGPT